jgi:hypothetical protein
MSEVIKFPSASSKSKLSACPTTKVPQAIDWIYQDFFNTMLADNDEHGYVYLPPSVQISELYPTEKYMQTSNGHKQQNMSYQHYLSYTSFSEALHVVVEPHSSTAWDNNIDYHFCPTSPDDQASLPDLDNTKSGDEEEEDEVEEDSVVDPIGILADFSELVNVAPVLIESTISSCTTSTEDAMSFRDDTIINDTTEAMIVQNSSINQSILKKRKSTSSFSSLKSFMNVFNSISNKRSKLDHHPLSTATNTATPSSKKGSVSSTLSKKILRYFKRRS